MKKSLKNILILAMAVAALAMCFSGCEKNNEVADATEEVKLTYSGEYLYVTYEGEKISVGVTESKILEVLGEDHETQKMQSCMFDGYDMTYTYDFATLFTFPQEGYSENVADEIFFTGNVKAKDGITFGSTKDEVISVFGDNYFMNGDLLCYNEAGDIEQKDVLPMIYFTFDNDLVSGIGLLANLYHTEG